MHVATMVAFDDELKKIGSEDKTDIDRAREYGRRGAKIYAVLGAASALARPEMREALKADPVGAIIGTGINAGIGYGIGRLSHRILHGAATGKKLKQNQ